MDLFRQIETSRETGGAVSYLVVGLGNPGKEYAETRHNVGFRFIDALAQKQGVRIDRAKFHSLVADVTLSGKRILLVKPQTFMNSSGIAVKEAADFYKIPPERILVVYDFEELSEIKEHLKNKHGFKIDGIDEELFIIDDDNGLYPYDADLASAWERYEILKDIDTNILKILSYEHIRSMNLDELEKIGDDYIFYSDYTFYDYAVEIFNELYLDQIPDNLKGYIDYDAFARDLGFNCCYIESSDGLLVECA